MRPESDPLRPDSSGGVKAMASVRMGQAFLHQAPGSGDVESRRVRLPPFQNRSQGFWTVILVLICYGYVDMIELMYIFIYY